MATKKVKRYSAKRRKKAASVKSKSVYASYIWGKDIDLDKEVIYDLTGKRLTNSRAEAFAKRALINNVGRPSLTAPSKVSPEIKARVPRHLKIKVDKVAKARKQTVSEIVREALESFCAQLKSSY